MRLYVVGLTPELEARARQVYEHGVPILDAAHLASAEAGGAEVLLTCDDSLLDRAGHLQDAHNLIPLSVQIRNPAEYLQEVRRNG